MSTEKESDSNELCICLDETRSKREYPQAYKINDQRDLPVRIDPT